MARAPTTPYAKVRAAFLAGQIDKYDMAQFIQGKAWMSGRCFCMWVKSYKERKMIIERRWLGRRFANEAARQMCRMRKL